MSSKAQAAGSTGLSEEQARALMQQLLVAADYCHRLGIALYNMRVWHELPCRRVKDTVTAQRVCGMSTWLAVCRFCSC